jgi:predicted ATPase
MSVTVTRRRRGDLPVEVTSFVGRRRELAEIRSLLSSCRLVTVSGAGGVGKTRLAVKAAHELRRAFADGVWMVELADLNDPGLVAHTVATAIGLRLDSSRRPVDQLREYLADKQALILLDNCEHLVDACAVLVDALLRGCPRLRVLATSRHSLGITGECTMAVPPLSVPGPDAADSAGDVTSYDSVRLLQDRVGAVLPGFSVTHENSGTVA